MIKIAIFQSDLEVGGIQKSLVNLLNHIDYNKYQVDLYLFSDPNSEKDFFTEQLTKNVNVQYLKPYNSITKLIPFKILYRLKRVHIDKEYDVAIDFNSYQMYCSIYALGVKAKKRIIWCHNDVCMKIKEEFKYRILFWAFKGKYSMFDKIVAVSKGAKESLLQKIFYNEDDVIVIPNYIDDAEIIEKAESKIDFQVSKDVQNFVSMGRFTHQKGFDILLNDFEDALNYRNDIHLYIIGDGNLYSEIKNMICEKNLKDYVTLLGAKKNPFPYLKQMDSFILTSRYEGQGMVLLEAYVMGLELIFPKNLEKYNENLLGTDSVVNTIRNSQKKEKEYHKLDDYNFNILERFYNVIK